MHLKTVTIANFRSIAALELRLVPGLNVLFGPNEAGKSTLVNALHAAFFVNADSTKAGRYRSWDSQADPSVRVVFEAAGSEYTLEKIFLGAKKGRLVCPGTGLDTQNKDAIAEELAKLLPLYTSDGKSIRTTFWIAQRSLEETVAALPDDTHLRSALQQILFRADGDLEEIKKNLKKTIADHKKGLERHADNPGPVAQARREMERLEAEVAEGRAQLDAVERNIAQQQELTDRVSRLQAQIDEDNGLLNAAEKYRQAVKGLEEADRELAALQEDLEAFQSAERKLREGRERAQALQKERTEREHSLRLFRTAAERGEVEEALRGETALLEAVRDLARRLADLEAELGAWPRVAKESLEKARACAHEVEVKKETFRASQLTVRATALADRTLRVAEDGAKARDEELAKDSAKTFRATQKLRIVVPRVVALDIASGASNAAQLRNDLAAAEESLAALLAAAGVQTVAELSGRFDAQQKLAAAMDVVRAEQKAKLGGRTPSDVERAVASLGERKAALGAELAGYVSPADASAEALARLREQILEEVARVEAEIAQLEQGQPKFAARYGSLDEATQKMKELARRAWVAKAGLEEIPRIELPDDQLFARKKRLDENRAEHARTRDELLRISGALQSAPLSSDQLRLREAELADARALYEARMLEYDAYRILEETLAAAEAEVAANLMRPVEQNVKPMLARLTAGRYGGLALNERLEVEGVGFRDRSVDLDDLSTGVQGQLALALRLALVDHLAGGERQTVIVDDALVNFDPERLAEGKNLLAEFAARHQIIYLSCHPEVRKWKGAEVFELGPG